MAVEREIRIKAYEIDAMGVVSNIEYVKWFEDIRHDFLDRYYPYDEMMKRHLSPVLINTDIRYRIPLTIHDRPVGRCWVTKMGRAKWEIRFEIGSEAGVHCTGVQTGGFYDVAARKPAPIPDRLREAFGREAAAIR